MSVNPEETRARAEDDLSQLPRRDLGAAQARHRQSQFRSIALVLVALVPLEVYIVGRVDFRLVLAHFSLSAAFLVAARLTRRKGSSIANAIDRSMSTASSVFLVTVVVLTGGARSPFLPWCLVMPVAVTVFARRQNWGSVLSSLICCVSTMVFVWASHPSGQALAGWALLVFTSAFIAVSSSVLQARVLNTVQSLGTSRSKLGRRRAQNERQRLEARRLALVGQLAAGVAHEVNNPLAVVKANLGFARSELQSRVHEPWCGVVLESLGEAAGGVERIRLLVRDLADLSPHSRQATAAEECEPAELVADAVDLVRGATSVAILNETAPDLPSVRVVRHHLVQVLRSLLQNAVDAVDGLPAGSPRNVLIRASGGPLGIQFEVEDSGSGFSETVLTRLFEPFFTTKPVGGGKGLNLAKSREHVTRSGGSISAENLPEGGARLTVRLPAARPLSRELPAA
jgi:two-component system, NtrC family, sensor kinase